MGGLLVFEALLTKQDYFTNFLAIDPYLAFDNESYMKLIIDKLNYSDLQNENLFIAYADTLDRYFNVKSLEKDTLEILRLTKSNLKFKLIVEESDWKMNITQEHFPYEDHFSIPLVSTNKAMRFFYSYYKFNDIVRYYHPAYAKRTDLIDRLKNHYQAISDSLGYEVIPMESYLNSWANGLAHFNRMDLAINLFDYNISLFPDNSSVYNSKGYFLMNNNMNKKAIKLFEKSLELKDDDSITKVIKELEESGIK